MFRAFQRHVLKVQHLIFGSLERVVQGECFGHVSFRSQHGSLWVVIRNEHWHAMLGQVCAPLDTKSCRSLGSILPSDGPWVWAYEFVCPRRSQKEIEVCDKVLTLFGQLESWSEKIVGDTWIHR